MSSEISLPIYMDNHATTRMDPRVLQAMLPYFTEIYGNAASRTHRFGWEAEAAVSDARETIAQFIGAESEKEIVFTSGATESNNLAIKGAAEFYKSRGNHIITTVIEHKAVLDSCKRLETQGYQVTYLPVGTDGLVDPEAVRAAITDKTILVSVMLANNEVGTIQPIKEIGKITREKGVLLHTDAVQGLGKTPFDFMPPAEAQRVGAEFAAIAAAKAPFRMLENVIRRKDGRDIVVETSGVPILDASGAFHGYRGIDRDVTQRKLAQEALQRRDALLHTVALNASDLAAAPSLDEAMPKIMDLLGRTVGADRIAVIEQPVKPRWPTDRDENRRPLADPSAAGVSQPKAKLPPPGASLLSRNSCTRG